MTRGEADPMAVFAGMLREVLGESLADAENFPAMFADDVIVEHPYAPPDGQVIRGRVAMTEHVGKTGTVFTIGRAKPQHVMRGENGTAFVLEFDLSGHWLQDRRPYQQSCFAIIDVLNGKISRYREYWNPQAPGISPPT